jgi:hypothetical protein
MDADGYLKTWINGKWKKIHRLIMEYHCGFKLHPDEIVHHDNEIKSDNRWYNLLLETRRDHSYKHAVRRYGEEPF